MSINGSMRERRPGQLVIERLLAEQSLLKPRSAVARFLGVSPLGIDSRSWYRGALGEIAVGRILDSLPSEWIAIHALPIGTGDSDIDHLVVGPAGAFTINTKHHRGKKIWVAGPGFLVDGQKTFYISNSESEADKVTRLLEGWMPAFPAVTPLIVLVDPAEITIKRRPDRVRVMDARQLRRWLLKQPTVIDAAALEMAVARLTDPRSWRIEGFVTDDSGNLFASLDREVRSAATRRRLWLVAAALALVAIVIAVLSHL